jgi:hypothetical protein
VKNYVLSGVIPVVWFKAGRKWVFMTVVTQLYLGKTWKQLHVSAPNWVGHYQVENKKTWWWPTQLGAETCSCFQDFPKYSCVTTVINTHFVPDELRICIFHSVLLRVGNLLDKICGENQNTCFMVIHFCNWKLCHLWDNVWKYATARQAADANMIWFRKGMLYLQDDEGKNMDTWLIIFNTCCFETDYFHQFCEMFCSNTYKNWELA